MKCSKCGTENMDSMAFCSVCGTVLVDVNAAPVPQMEPMQNASPAAAPAPAATAVADPPFQPPVYNEQPPMGPGPMQGPPMAPPPPVLECGQCKKPFGPEEPFCTQCGAPRQMAVSRPAKAPKSGNSTKTIIMIVIAIVVLAGAAFGVYALIRSNNYKDAVAAMDSGNYQEAYDAFEKLGSYNDSATRAAECFQYIRYDEALLLMEEGKYLEAKEILDELGSFNDASSKANDCLKFIEYEEAIALYNAGSYYQAYKIFVSLGAFEDCSEWANKCIQPSPANGVVEQGPAYAVGTAVLQITNGSFYDLCIMLYTENGTYWGLIFVGWYSSATVYVETGRYYIGAGSGEYWFGPTDMFGDDGYYEEPIYFGSGESVFEVTDAGVGITLS